MLVQNRKMGQNGIVLAMHLSFYVLVDENVSVVYKVFSFFWMILSHCWGDGVKGRENFWLPLCYHTHKIKFSKK